MTYFASKIPSSVVYGSSVNKLSVERASYMMGRVGMKLGQVQLIFGGFKLTMIPETTLSKTATPFN